MGNAETALSFTEEWNFHSGASKTLGAGNVTGLLACGAALSYASTHPIILAAMLQCLALFVVGTLLFCLGYTTLYAGYLSLSLSNSQSARWKTQADEELALQKIGHKRVALPGDVHGDDSFKSLMQHSRFLHTSLVFHSLSMLMLFAALIRTLSLSLTMVFSQPL